MDIWRSVVSQASSGVGLFSSSSTYAQAGIILVLLFILILLTAQLRRHFIDWSVKGAVFGIFIGFLLALLLEGSLLIGGKTALTEVLGWQNAPAPVVKVLDLGRRKLVQVLGIKDEIPFSLAKTGLTAGDVITFFQSLNPAEVEKAKQIICR